MSIRTNLSATSTGSNVQPGPLLLSATVRAWTPVYDPGETLAQFRERQRQAFAAFEEAWREGRVAMRLKLFYDALVRRVGANQYAWMSEVTMAADFRVSVSSIQALAAGVGVCRSHSPAAPLCHDQPDLSNRL